MDRREAIGALEWLRLKAAKPIYSNMHEALDLAIGALQEPTLVRCKDCKHRDLFSCPLVDNDFQKDEDFCSWGEAEKHQLSGETSTISEKESVEGVAESATTTDWISRAKAIEEVKALPDTDNGYSDAYDKACIIGVLEELPSVAPKPVGDCISRADTIKALCAKCGLGHSCGDGYECPDVAVVRDMPPVEPKRPKGEWINGNPICPCCGENKFKDLDADIWSDWQPKYCPNCGADMRGDKE